MKSQLALKVLLGITFGISTSLAHGVTLTAHGDYFIAANPNFGILTNLSDSQTQTNSSNASVAIGAGYGSGMGAASASAYADDTGVIGTQANGREQQFNATGNANSSTSILNSTGVDMHYFYTLNIPTSSLGMYANWFGAGDTFTATNQFSVDLNGSSIWSSLASINMTSSAVNFNTSGQPLPWTSSLNNIQSQGSGYSGGGTLDLSNHTLLLDLGIWGAGKSLTLDYNILSSVAVSAPSSCGYECFDISAYIGDPSGASGVPVLGSISGTPAVVPVPSAVWLLGSGLIGLIGVARQRIV